jgi:rhodanese-related sulfurtransferase/DNA-binding transcriptional ArsR family regulator
MHLDTHGDFTQQVFLQLASICKGFGNERRLELLELLLQGEYSVEELARELEISVASASQHLQILRSARLVSVQRSGVKALYRISHPNVYGVLRALYRLGKTHLVELETLESRYLPERQWIGEIEFAELYKRMRDEPVCILDVRPEREFLSGHIAGARSIPLATLGAQAHTLPREDLIVVYCRGPYDTLADEAARLLHDMGFSVRRLAWGYPEWKAQELPVESPGLKPVPK